MKVEAVVTFLLDLEILVWVSDKYAFGTMYTT